MIERLAIRILTRVALLLARPRKDHWGDRTGLENIPSPYARADLRVVR